jgi:hypothetical protein
LFRSFLLPFEIWESILPHPVHVMALVEDEKKLIWMIGGVMLTGKTEVIGEKVCPSATLSTTDPTWTGLVLNPGNRGERPKLKRLTHDRAVSSGNSLLAAFNSYARKIM